MVHQRTAFVDVCRSSLHHRNVPSACRRVGFRTDPAVRIFHADGLADALRPLQSLPQATTETTSLSSFLPSSALFLSRAVPAIVGTISNAITSVISLLLPMAGRLQRTGETLLAAFILLSVLQAAVALYQYRYDERGQLVFPDGPTSGKEDYFADDFADAIRPAFENRRAGERSEEEILPSIVANEPPTETGIDEANSSWATKFVKKLNRSLVLLLPWITRNVHNILTKNTHLFHIGFILFTLDSFLPFMIDGGSDESAGGRNDETGKSYILQKIDSSSKPSLSLRNQDPIRILVIGDSLSIGIGCIEQFDSTKDNSVPMALIENTAASQSSKTKIHSCQGPVFPQALARTLSYHFRQPVQWRSAGVDGGDVNDIRSFCMDVVKQESAKGDIDIVVALFGMNDLKNLLSTNPIRHLFRKCSKGSEGGGTTNHFRHGMEMLLSDINACAPGSLVVFPAMPVQPFNKNSIINIFPLGLLVDAVLGVWERQKKIVANNSQGSAMFLELKAKEIADWYSSSSDENQNVRDCLNSDLGKFSPNEDFASVKDVVLLSEDGVHPNKRMYAKWAELVGHKLYERIAPRIEPAEQKHGWLASEIKGVQAKAGEPAKGNKKTKLEA